MIAAGEKKTILKHLDFFSFFETLGKRGRRPAVPDSCGAAVIGVSFACPRDFVAATHGD